MYGEDSGHERCSSESFELSSEKRESVMTLFNKKTLFRTVRVVNMKWIKEIEIDRIDTRTNIFDTQLENLYFMLIICESIDINQVVLLSPMDKPYIRGTFLYQPS